MPATIPITQISLQQEEPQVAKRLAVLLVMAIACASEVAAQMEALAPEIRQFEAELLQARVLPLSAVRLTGGPLQAAQAADAAFLLGLEADRALAALRLAAGLEAKAAPFGGWDGAAGRQLTGHIAGHALSAVSVMYAATGDARFKQKADYLVSELLSVQSAQGDGYIGAQQTSQGIPGKQRLTALSAGVIESEHREDLNGLWAPWYVEHKLLAGLRDAYRLTGNERALAVEQQLAAWIEATLAPLSEAQIQQMLASEFGGMNEVLADLYADTGDRRWLALSYRFEEKIFAEPLARGEDITGGLHGNTSIPKMTGSADQYAYAGRAEDLAAATFFWRTVVDHHTFATGGNSAFRAGEFFPEADRLAAAIENDISAYTNESCNVYNMLNLTRRLFAIEPRAEYADYLERALFNHSLGQIDPATGALSYHVPVGQRVRHDYQGSGEDINSVFSCCVGTGLENAGLFGLGLYYQTGTRLWVNVYAPSTAEAQALGAKLTLQTSLPEGDTARLTLSLDGPRQFTLALRRPFWTTAAFAIRVNGQPQQVAAIPTGVARSTYVEITRTWRDGDAIEVVLPKQLRLEATPDNPNLVALLWGPLVLGENLGPASARGTGAVLRNSTHRSVLQVGSPDPSDWLLPVDGRPGEFRFTGGGRTTALPDAAETANFLAPVPAARPDLQRVRVPGAELLRPALALYPGHPSTGLWPRRGGHDVAAAVTYGRRPITSPVGPGRRTRRTSLKPAASSQFRYSASLYELPARVPTSMLSANSAPVFGPVLSAFRMKSWTTTRPPGASAANDFRSRVRFSIRAQHVADRRDEHEVVAAAVALVAQVAHTRLYAVGHARGSDVPRRDRDDAAHVEDLGSEVRLRERERDRIGARAAADVEYPPDAGQPDRLDHLRRPERGVLVHRGDERGGPFVLDIAAPAGRDTRALLHALGQRGPALPQVGSMHERRARVVLAARHQVARGYGRVGKTTVVLLQQAQRYQRVEQQLGRTRIGTEPLRHRCRVRAASGKRCPATIRARCRAPTRAAFRSHCREMSSSMAVSSTRLSRKPWIDCCRSSGSTPASSRARNDASILARLPSISTLTAACSPLRSRSTIRPSRKCSRTISSTSAGRTPEYHTPSGYTTRLGPRVQRPSEPQVVTWTSAASP